MTEHDAAAWPWATWDGADGTVNQRFGGGDEGRDDATDADRGVEPVADGGTTRSACPRCGGTTASGQGLHWCGDCDWSGVR